MPINILYMIDSLQYGGTEKQLYELINGLDRSEFCPYVCTLKQSSRIAEEIDVPVLQLPYKSFLHPSVFFVLQKLSAFIRENNIDIVQTFFQDPFLLAALSKPFHKAKLVGSFRDLGFWRTRSETLKMRLSYPFFTGFIANSQAVKRHFVETDGIAEEKIKVIYNGINLKSVSQLPCRDRESMPIVGIVANCNRPVKRVDDFIRAAALVHKQWPDVRFQVVGDGNLRPELETLCATLGIREYVEFVGNVPNPLDYIRQFTVGVITSETEGFCNAILEYMACGVPVVATNTGGNPELVEDKVNGYLFAVKDVNMLSEKIGLILDEKYDKELIYKINIDKVDMLYDVNIYIKNHGEIYRRLFRTFYNS